MNAKKRFSCVFIPDQITGLILSLIIVFIGSGCEEKQQQLAKKILPESEITEIKMSGIGSERFIEASGLAWYNDYLIILPQFPHKVSEEADGALLYLKKQDLEEYLNNQESTALTPEKVKFSAVGMDKLGKRKGSGYEGIAISGNSVYLSIESFDNKKYSSYLYSGTIEGDLDSVVIDSGSVVPIESNSGLKNMGEEAILYNSGLVTCIHEANGNLNTKKHVATEVNLTDGEKTKITFPNIEYRITDASKVDSTGNFWVINYYYPGDSLIMKPQEDYYSFTFGIGKTNVKFKPVERLLKLHLTNNGIAYTSQPPVYIKLDNNSGRNWEGLVKLDNKGFLLITDYYPRTLLAFVPLRSN